MSMVMTPRVVVLAVLLVGAAFASSAEAQNRPGAQARGGVSPAELQRLFDAYVLMEAQQTLKLTDEQYPRFLTRVRVLQEARRRSDLERRRIVQELRRILQAGGTDEARIKERLKALDDVQARSAAEILQAQNSLDEILDVQQQARFRLFEEAMEQRKVDLLMRARQANRPRAGVPGANEPQP
jgi:Spy/CpxP family protein refolding chaperone